MNFLKFFSLLSIMLSLVLLNISALFSADAKQSGTVKGRLIDYETKEPLVGANIEILASQLGASTDQDGKFEIPEIPIGNYSLKFTYIGYKPIVQTDVIVRPQRITFVDLELEPTTLESETISVSAGYFREKAEQPVSSINFSAEEIRRAPGSGGDVSRIIYGLPGVAKVNDTKNSLIVRGGSALENSFYADNIEISNINHFPEQGSSGGPIGMISVDLIKDVNFHTGGYNSSYGDRLSSVMELNLREGNREEVDAQLDLGFSGFGGIAEGPLPNNKGSWLFSARRSYLDFIVDAIQVTGGAVPEYGDLFAKIVYALSPKHRLTLMNLSGIDAINFPRDVAVEEQENMYSDLKIWQNTLGLNLRSIWDESGFSNTSFSHAITKYDFILHNTRHFISTGAERIVSDQASDEQEFRLRNVNHFCLNEFNKIDFGLESKLLAANFNNYYGPYYDITGNETPALLVTGKKSAIKLHGFLDYTWNPVTRLTFRPGIRIAHFTYNSNTNISPRFTMTYQLTEQSSITFSAGIYYQNLPLVLLAQQEANKKLKDPRSFHYILGFSRLLSENTRLTIEAYEKQYEHLPLDPAQPYQTLLDEMIYTGIFLTHGPLVDVGKAYSRGIEVTVQKKLAQNIYGMVSASYFRSRYRDYLNNWHNRLYDNRFTFNVEGGYKPNKKWEFSLRWIFAGGIPYTPFNQGASMANQRGILDTERVNGLRKPNYHSLNVRLDRRFFFSGSNIVLYVSIWNAYGRENLANYSWNEIKNVQEEEYQWGTLPILGVEFEF